MSLEGFSLVLFLSAVTLKIVDLIKERFPIPETFYPYLPIVSVGIGMAFSFGIEPLKIFSILGVEGVSWWLDKIITGLSIGLGASFIWDLMDTEKRV